MFLSRHDGIHGDQSPVICTATGTQGSLLHLDPALCSAMLDPYGKYTGRSNEKQAWLHGHETQNEAKSVVSWSRIMLYCWRCLRLQTQAKALATANNHNSASQLDVSSIRQYDVLRAVYLKLSARG